ncbi:glycosyltransferase family 2 protein [Flavobacterium sp. LC2016-12]|uniref:glycosyltransferase family 2 protein n=1 Tax=Flavobacterium sp. LC2016-12 TaxID=2783794 RepID=UPI00188BED66|nr:glycosyltransferase family 2 protein [Flavobacterium sp. LC2016-12]MBF4465656.1 glycosyltransferase [Flavobacterium sp. LC2016-12]
MKLTIITINYNNLNGLKKTVESVVNQTWQEFEYIVIDGGSKDGSADYIERHSDKIDYWISEPDNGIYNAMNKGIAKANGEYLLFLNSGDHFYDNATLYENHHKINNFDLIYFNILYVDQKESKNVSYPDILDFSFFYTGTLCHQSTIIKKELFDIVGLYDEDLKIVADWKFFILALFKFNCSYQKVNKTLATYYLDGLSSDNKNAILIYKEREAVLNSNFAGHINDIKQMLKIKGTLSSLKKSKKIQFLVKLGFLRKFD